METFNWDLTKSRLNLTSSQSQYYEFLAKMVISTDNFLETDRILSEKDCRQNLFELFSFEIDQKLLGTWAKCMRNNYFRIIYFNIFHRYIKWLTSRICILEYFWMNLKFSKIFSQNCLKNFIKNSNNFGNIFIQMYFCNIRER